MVSKANKLRWYKAQVVCCLGNAKGQTFVRDVIANNMTEAQRKMSQVMGNAYRLAGLHYAGTAAQYIESLQSDMGGGSDSVSD